MAGKLKVLITGASGYVASQMLPEYRETLRSRPFDVKNTDRDGEVVDGVVVADLADPDRSRYEHLFDGLTRSFTSDTCGLNPGGVFGSETPQIDRFDVELTKRAHGQQRVPHRVRRRVRRVVSASSNHAADWYETTRYTKTARTWSGPMNRPFQATSTAGPRQPTNCLAWPYACGTFGRRLEFVMVRIGHPTPVNAARHMAEDPGLPAGGIWYREL